MRQLSACCDYWMNFMFAVNLIIVYAVILMSTSPFALSSPNSKGIVSKDLYSPFKSLIYIVLDEPVHPSSAATFSFTYV